MGRDEIKDDITVFFSSPPSRLSRKIIFCPDLASVSAIDNAL